MAKMFYTLEEAATRLGMAEDEVASLGESGQLQEFRDRDRLMFKKDQVDLLAGDGAEEMDDIHLAETGEMEPMSLSASGSGSAFNMPSEGSAGADASDTGISIFDPDETEADSNADTLVSDISDSEFAIGLADSGASGSGLAQLALEADDTSLGGTDLLGGLGDESALDLGSPGGSALGESDFGGDAGTPLFEGGGGDVDFNTAAAATAASTALIPAVEVFDGPWSGIAGGAAVGMTLLLMATIGVMILGFTGAGASALLGGIDDTMLMGVAGGGLVVVLLSAIIGWVLLRKS